MRTLALTLSLCFCGGLVAEDGVTLQPGVIAKIYALGLADSGQGQVDYGKQWPFPTLPDAPGEVLVLPAIPSVRPPSASDFFNKGAQTNTLVQPKTKILQGVNFYAVEFEGFLTTQVEGLHTITVISDDPVEVFIEGRSVGNSKFTANPNDGVVWKNDSWWHKSVLDSPDLKPQTASMQGVASLATNKIYHIVVLCRQAVTQAVRDTYAPHGGPFGGHADGDEFWSSTLNRGAYLDVTLTTPDGKTGPLPLRIPVVAK